MNESRDKTINIRVSESEKEEINKRAESVGLDISSLIRNAILTDEKIIFLQDGTKISANLCTFVSDFQKALKAGKIDSTYAPVLLSRIEFLVSLFNDVTDKLSDLSESEEIQ